LDFELRLRSAQSSLTAGLRKRLGASAALASYKQEPSWKRDGSFRSLPTAFEEQDALRKQIGGFVSGLFGISQGHGVGVPNLLGGTTPHPQQVGDSGLLFMPTPKDPVSV